LNDIQKTQEGGTWKGGSLKKPPTKGRDAYKNGRRGVKPNAQKRRETPEHEHAREGANPRRSKERGDREKEGNTGKQRKKPITHQRRRKTPTQPESRRDADTKQQRGASNNEGGTSNNWGEVTLQTVSARSTMGHS